MLVHNLYHNRCKHVSMKRIDFKLANILLAASIFLLFALKLLS